MNTRNTNIPLQLSNQEMKSIFFDHSAHSQTLRIAGMPVCPPDIMISTKLDCMENRSMIFQLS